MNFSSLLFIFCFLPIFLLTYYVCPKRFKYIVLLIGSVLFYLYSGLFNLIILLILSTVNYILTLIISKKEKLNKLLIVLVVLNLLTLLIFKYNDSFIFPLGISFYIFNNISYVIDVMKKKIIPEKNYLYYLVYSMLFCHVTMGPICRYDVLSDNFKNINYSLEDITSGFKRFLGGLFRKVIFANNLGLLYVTLAELGNQNFFTILFSLIVFALQLYLDFSGYCDMAIGLGKMIGLNYPENFNYPYQALSISDFWRRWHITLSEFFKEYVYFPMGGNRVSKIRNIFNLLVVWFLTGMWHGNTWNFLLWGVYYGVILIIEKYLLKNILLKIPKLIKHIYVLVIVLIGYIFFSMNSLEAILSTFKALFTFTSIDGSLVFYLKEHIVLLIVSYLLCFKLLDSIIKKLENSKTFNIIVCISYIVLFVIAVCYILNSSYQPFLYNNF